MKTKLSLAITLLLFPLSAYAHQGRLDSYGCHNNRKAHTYDCHRGAFKGQSFPDKSAMIGAKEGDQPKPAQETFKAKVISVIDGDTIEVLRSGKAIRIRLADIDAPEMAQDYGPESRQFVVDQVLGKQVIVKVTGIGIHGRHVAEIILSTGESLNRNLVKSGQAWWYQKYSTRSSFSILEASARNKRVGLWKNNEPVSPWKFRTSN